MGAVKSKPKKMAVFADEVTFMGNRIQVRHMNIDKPDRKRTIESMKKFSIGYYHLIERTFNYLMRTSEQQIEIAGATMSKKTDMEFFSSDKISLLEKIDECGSITGAANALGISYKTAWDTMRSLNDLSVKPLFVRLAGDTLGDGSTLTEEGRQLVREFRIMQQEREKFLANLAFTELLSKC